MNWLYRNGFSTSTLQEYWQYLYGAIKIPANKVVITFDDAYVCLEDAAEIMAEFGFRGCCFAISDFVGKSNSWDYQFLNRKLQHADYRLLRQLVSEGWEVGSHTKCHAFLPTIPHPTVFENLQQSKVDLENNLGVPVSSLSYPYGKCNKTICEMAKKCGFKIAVSLGMPRQQPHDLMNLPRIGIYLFDNIFLFARKIEQTCAGSDFYFQIQQIISKFSYGSIVFNHVKTCWVNAATEN